MTTTLTSSTFESGFPAKAVVSGVTRSVILGQSGIPATGGNSATFDVHLMKVPNRAVITDFVVKVETKGGTGAFSLFRLKLANSGTVLVPTLSASSSAYAFAASDLMTSGVVVAVPHRVSLTVSSDATVVPSFETLVLEVAKAGVSGTASFSIGGWVDWIMDDPLMP